MQFVYYGDSLEHHGILGQKWGVKNGPPYPLGGGDYSESELKKIKRHRRLYPNSNYNKKHFDEVIKKGTKLSTLSFDPNRTKNTDAFYAVHNKRDAHMYNAFFNRPMPQPFFDKDGNEIGSGTFLKFKITNKLVSNMKVASEDSGANSFKKLYSQDRDFYNFVTDPNRMQSHFDKSRYRHKGYREAKEALESLRKKKKPTSEELDTIYRMFNYTIPSDGQGDAKRAKDVAHQRAKFFNELKKSGYDAVLDTNDAIYNKFNAASPIIVFNQDKIAFSDSKRTTLRSKRLSRLVTVGRKALGII